jgi:hypothetical protein
MQTVLDFLNGRKTYITAFLFAVFNFGLSMGWWTAEDQIILMVNSLLAALGWGFLRAGVSKSSLDAKKIVK